LKAGSHLISGVHSAKVRVMNDSAGKPVKIATPGMAVTVSGWKSLPSAGDEVLEGSEGDIKKAVANRVRKAEIDASIVDVEAINANRKIEREKRELELKLEAQAAKTGRILPQTPMMQEQEHQGPKELKLIIKADVSGSAEAVVGALEGMGNQHAVTKIISSGVGEVTESDLDRAKAVGGKFSVSFNTSLTKANCYSLIGMVVAFSVPVPRAIQNQAQAIEVPILSSDVIYRIMDDVREKVIDLLPKIVETSVLGEATVLEMFDIKKSRQEIMRVAGCRVGYGVLQRSKRVRLMRDGETIYDGKLIDVKLPKIKC
jgi:translation initiation factor IF-2